MCPQRCGDMFGALFEFQRFQPRKAGGDKAIAVECRMDRRNAVRNPAHGVRVQNVFQRLGHGCV